MPKFILICLVLLSLISCSSLTDDEGIFRDRKYDYRKAKMVPRMEIPEHLDDEAIVDYYVIPETSPHILPENFDNIPLPTDMVGQAGAAVKIQRVATEQWILLQIPPSRVWPRLKEFISLKGLPLTLESSGAGVVEAGRSGNIYRFQVGQGFQRNTSEMAIRFLDSAESAQGFWPATSSDVEKEYAMLEQLAEFFAEVSDKPAYSFAAQGISTQKKLDVVTNNSGSKSLVLYVSQVRAIATLRRGLESAGFTIEEYLEPDNRFSVRYTPAVPEDDQPGFFLRMLGFKPKPFDDEAEYGGNRYFVDVSGNGDAQRVSLQIVESDNSDEILVRAELNKQLLLLKGHLQ